MSCVFRLQIWRKMCMYSFPDIETADKSACVGAVPRKIMNSFLHAQVSTTHSHCRQVILITELQRNVGTIEFILQ